MKQVGALPSLPREQEQQPQARVDRTNQGKGHHGQSLTHHTAHARTHAQHSFLSHKPTRTNTTMPFSLVFLVFSLLNLFASTIPSRPTTVASLAYRRQPYFLFNICIFLCYYRPSILASDHDAFGFFLGLLHFLYGAALTLHFLCGALAGEDADRCIIAVAVSVDPHPSGNAHAVEKAKQYFPKAVQPLKVLTSDVEAYASFLMAELTGLSTVDTVCLLGGGYHSSSGEGFPLHPHLEKSADVRMPLARATAGLSCDRAVLTRYFSSLSDPSQPLLLGDSIPFLCLC